MLHQLLNLTRPLILFDCETTGTNTDTDRIIEFGFQVWDATGVTKEWRSLINPGVPIPEESTRVHGITDAMVKGCKICGMGAEDTDAHAMLGDNPHTFATWPTFKTIAPGIAKGFSNCDYAGKNIRFDIRITAAEMEREGIKWSYADARIICADRLEQLAVPRSLSDLYKKYTGQEMENAHSALDDVRGTAVILAGQLETHPNLPRDLDALHKAQWPGWIDGSGKFRFINGVACFSNWGKFANKPMSDPEVNRPGRNGQTYWDFILGASFPEDVKELARKAKLKQFPKEHQDEQP